MDNRNPQAPIPDAKDRRAATLRLSTCGRLLVLFLALGLASSCALFRGKPPLEISEHVEVPASLQYVCVYSPVFSPAIRYLDGYVEGMQDYLRQYIEEEEETDRREEIVNGRIERIGAHSDGWHSAKSQIAVLEKSYTREEVVDCARRVLEGE